MTTQIVAIEAKPWYASKLFWLGILQVVMGILETVKTQLGDVPDASTLVGPVQASPEAAGIVPLIFGILTLIWRWKTNRPLAKSKELVDVPVKETTSP